MQEPVGSVGLDFPREQPAASLLSVDAAIAGLVAVVLPFALIGLGLAPANRTLYPAAALMAGGYLCLRRSPWHLALCIWLFCASPLVRRLTDFQLGWEPSSPVLLAPYLACWVTAWSFPRYCLGQGPRFNAPFIAVMLCIFYGLMLAMLNGRIVSGLVDCLKWGCGPLLAVHLLLHADQHEDYGKVVLYSFALAAPIMALYGIAQFLNPLPWDREWMLNVAEMGMNTIGRPEPFEIRVFGTMHSPGSLANYLMTGVILSFGLTLPLAVPGSAVIILTLALAQYRAVWAGTLAGMLCLLLTGTAREKVRILTGMLVLVLVASSTTILPEIQDVVARRVQTLTELETDMSGEDRLRQYADFLTAGDDLLLGQGLALTGASRQMDQQNATVIDSGIIEIYSALGIFMGTLLLVSIGVLVFRAVTVPRLASPCIPLYRAVIVGIYLQMPFGSIHVGETGTLGWIFIGLALAAAIAREENTMPHGGEFH